MLEHWEAREPFEPESLLCTSSVVLNRATVVLQEDLSEQLISYALKNDVEPMMVLAVAFLVLNGLYSDETVMQIGGNSGVELVLDVSLTDAISWSTIKQTNKALDAHTCPLFVGSIASDYMPENITLEVKENKYLTLILPHEALRYGTALVADNLISIIEQLVYNDNSLSMAQLTALSQSQMHWINSLNNTQQWYPQSTIASQFESQVKKSPTASALIVDGQVMSYSELNVKANRLAHYLIEKNVNVESRVVIYIDRGFDCLVAILAVMKSGAAFVPVDPVFTSTRTEYIVDDSSAKVILTQSHLETKLHNHDQQIISIDTSSHQLEQRPSVNPDVAIHPDNLAYIIYTSGSTGKPKGVLVAHRGVSNLVWSMAKAWNVNSDTRYLQFASMSFDASVPEWATTLTHGGCVIFKPSRALGLEPKLLDLIEAQSVTIVKMPAAALAVLPYRELLKLKVIITAGDACNQALVQRWGKGRHFFNCYGPTEMSIGTSMSHCDLNDEHPSIGRPNYNTEVYILDKELRPSPVGRIGEIYLSGVGLTRGYHMKPALTAQKFIPNPYKCDGSRLYQSGDLGYYRADGCIEFCGRTDDQVKIRGYRVSLGEIERVLMGHSDIENACVVVHENDGGQRLAVYFSSKCDIHRQSIADWLSQQLPHYMLPSIYKRLEKLSLTDNGKVDKKALPVLTDADIVSAYKAPRTVLEQSIAESWQQKLGFNRIGLLDNFYHLGGSSLNAVGVCSVLSDQLQQPVPIAMLLTNPVLQDFSDQLSKLELAHEDLPKRVERSAFPASSAQQRLFFMNALQPNSAFYNIGLALVIEGPLDIDKLDSCIQQLIKRHESLRTRFYLVDQSVYQEPLEVTYKNIAKVDTSTIKDEQFEQYLIAHGRELFDLETGRLFSVKLFKRSDSVNILSIAIHHIAADGGSIQKLINELMDSYAGLWLPDIPCQMIEYALWERMQVKKGSYQQSIAYWKSQFMHPVPPLALTNIDAKDEKPSYKGCQQTFTIDQTLLTSIKKRASLAGTTVFNLLLATFSLLLNRYTNTQDLVVAVPMVPDLPKNFNASVGLFANTLPIRIKIDDDTDFKTLVNQVSKRVNEAMCHQQVALQKILQLAESAGNDMLFRTLFTYQQVQYGDNKNAVLNISQYHYSNGTSKYALTLLIDDVGDKLQIRLEHDTALVSENLAKSMIKSFIALLQEQPLQSIVCGQALNDLLPVSEKIASIDGSRPALKWADGGLNYDALRTKSNTLIGMLIDRGIGLGDVVALTIRRDNPLLVLLELACLKLGAPILAISEKYPESRVRHMLDHATPALVISDSESENALEWPCWHIDDLNINDIAKNTTLPCFITPDLDDVAYIVYTSGSTGKPKGIEVCQRTLANLIQWQCKDYSHLYITDVLQFSAIGFDVALQELLYGLCEGCCYHLQDVESGYAFHQISNFTLKYPNSTVFMPTAIFHEYASYLVDAHAACNFKAIAVAGEALQLSDDISKKLSENYVFSLYNHYGPAETHVVTAMKVDLRHIKPMIGSPINNTTIIILDENNKPVPIGCLGELYIGGINLAKGYLNDSAQTKTKFVTINGQRFYASGDLARLLPNNYLDFVGRRDDQVKVRGFRVEPSEVSGALESVLGVQQALVLGVRDSRGEVALAAYVKLSESTISKVRTKLANLIPDYMMPTAWKQITDFDINFHGKIDRKKLPQLDWYNNNDIKSCLDDSTLDSVIAQLLIELWQEILDVQISDSCAHFFHLGGHSIKLMQLLAQIKVVFDVDASLADLMDRPMLSEQCTYIEQLALVDGRRLEAELMEGF